MPINENIDLCQIENTILIIKDVVLILNDEGTVIIMGEASYLFDGDYREEIAIEVLK